MDHKETLDKVMEYLLKNPYCKRRVKELLPVGGIVEISPELILGLRCNNPSYGNIIRNAYMEILEKYDGNVSAVSRIIGAERKSVGTDLKKYGLLGYSRIPKQ